MFGRRNRAATSDPGHLSAAQPEEVSSKRECQTPETDFTFKAVAPAHLKENVPSYSPNSNPFGQRPNTRTPAATAMARRSTSTDGASRRSPLRSSGAGRPPMHPPASPASSACTTGSSRPRVLLPPSPVVFQADEEAASAGTERAEWLVSPDFGLNNSLRRSWDNVGGMVRGVDLSTPSAAIPLEELSFGSTASPGRSAAAATPPLLPESPSASSASFDSARVGSKDVRKERLERANSRAYLPAKVARAAEDATPVTSGSTFTAGGGAAAASPTCSMSSMSTVSTSCSDARRGPQDGVAERVARALKRHMAIGGTSRIPLSSGKQASSSSSQPHTSSIPAPTPAPTCSPATPGMVFALGSDTPSSSPVWIGQVRPLQVAAPEVEPPCTPKPATAVDVPQDGGGTPPSMCAAGYRTTPRLSGGASPRMRSVVPRSHPLQDSRGSSLLDDLEGQVDDDNGTNNEDGDDVIARDDTLAIAEAERMQQEEVEEEESGGRTSAGASGEADGAPPPAAGTARRLSPTTSVPKLALGTVNAAAVAEDSSAQQQAGGQQQPGWPSKLQELQHQHQQQGGRAGGAHAAAGGASPGGSSLAPWKVGAVPSHTARTLSGMAGMLLRPPRTPRAVDTPRDAIFSTGLQDKAAALGGALGTVSVLEGVPEGSAGAKVAFSGKKGGEQRSSRCSSSWRGAAASLIALCLATAVYSPMLGVLQQQQAGSAAVLVWDVSLPGAVPLGGTPYDFWHGRVFKAAAPTAPGPYAGLSTIFSGDSSSAPPSMPADKLAPIAAPLASGQQRPLSSTSATSSSSTAANTAARAQGLDGLLQGAQAWLKLRLEMQQPQAQQPPQELGVAAIVEPEEEVKAVQQPSAATPVMEAPVMPEPVAAAKTLPAATITSRMLLQASRQRLKAVAAPLVSALAGLGVSLQHLRYAAIVAMSLFVVYYWLRVIRQHGAQPRSGVRDADEDDDQQWAEGEEKLQGPSSSLEQQGAHGEEEPTPMAAYSTPWAVFSPGTTAGKSTPGSAEAPAAARRSAGRRVAQTAEKAAPRTRAANKRWSMGAVPEASHLQTELEDAATAQPTKSVSRATRSLAGARNSGLPPVDEVDSGLAPVRRSTRQSARPQ